jgi:hypothetical protein
MSARRRAFRKSSSKETIGLKIPDNFCMQVLKISVGEIKCKANKYLASSLICRKVFPPESPFEYQN